MLKEKHRSALQDASLVLSLVRDSILTVIGILTIAITYMGGDPQKLNAADWTQLVSLASFIVLTPIVTYVLLKTLGKINKSLFEQAWNVLFSPETSRIPRGLVTFLNIKLLRMNKRIFITTVRMFRKKISARLEELPTTKKTIFLSYKYLVIFSSYPKWISLMYCLIVGVVTVYLFYKYLNDFIM